MGDGYETEGPGDWANSRIIDQDLRLCECSGIWQCLRVLKPLRSSLVGTYCSSLSNRQPRMLQLLVLRSRMYYHPGGSCEGFGFSHRGSRGVPALTERSSGRSLVVKMLVEIK